MLERKYVGGELSWSYAGASAFTLRSWKKEQLEALRKYPTHRDPATELALNEALSIKYPYERRDPASLVQTACEYYAIVNETIFHAEFYEDAELDVMKVRQWYSAQIDEIKKVCPGVPGSIKEALNYIEAHAPHLMLQVPQY